ncbi:hypothetical protein [Acetivibrio straminisolvens]|uniref:hypothetical protein n=1 Tax=Acetivibrio straminisolvens TaxID=253314 RepID=UPI00103B1C71|nr:hypothetical protein [Acetivibrio straminisolvens]
MMICAPADINLYTPANNLSTACKHSKTHTNLCSTIRDTLETCCNLSTATDLQHIILLPQGLLYQ